MYKITKRISDILLSFILLLVLSILLIIAALVIKLSSPGPIFYRAPRAGLNGKPFLIFKFRTMYLGADKGSGTTALNDPRTTKYGAFLRNYKIDELPQLINVLIGDMSLVGPRPELLDYVARYKGDEKIITTVKPGITDFSSLHFFMQDQWVGEGDAGEAFDNLVLPTKIALRVKYVKEQSFYTDIKVLMLTAKVLSKKILGLYKGKQIDEDLS
jgi:lipopolysaccharide/colanic/teichoic acid biosynthesis glycosyltransferase